MEYRSVETGQRGEGRIRVQRVSVARQAVGQRLILPGGQRHLKIGGRPLVRHAAGPRGPTLTAEAALATDEHRHDLVKHGLTIRRDRPRGHLDHGTLALVPDRRHLTRGHHRALHRQFPVQGDRLLTVHQHGRVECADVGEGTRGITQHHGLRWVGTLGDVHRIFGGKGQVGGACADADGIEQRVLGRPRRLDRRAGRADCVRIDCHGRSPRSGRPHGVPNPSHSVAGSWHMG